MKAKKADEILIVGIRYHKKSDISGPPERPTMTDTGQVNKAEISTITGELMAQGEAVSESDKSDMSSRFSWSRNSNKVQPSEISPQSDLTKYAVSPSRDDGYVVNNSIASSNQSFPQLKENSPEKKRVKEPPSENADQKQQSATTRRLTSTLLNLVLVGMFLGYAFFGGAVFVILENENSMNHYKDFQHARYVLMQSIANLSVCNATGNVDMKALNNAITVFEQKMNDIICHEKVDITGDRTWTFWNAVFFSATVISTIGKYTCNVKTRYYIYKTK